VRIAVDPGVSGGMAISVDGRAEAHKCPDSQRAVLDMVEEVKTRAGGLPGNIKAILEKVSPMPGEGVCSVWTFASNYTTWQMALMISGIPYKEVPPQKWMRLISGVPKGEKSKRKNFLKAYSQKIFPHLKVTLATGDALAMLDVFDRAWDA
jgi:hypothetical protein